MPTNFVLGFLFMWLARKEVAQHQTLWTTPLKWSWLFSAFVFCPVTGWSFYAYPAWATVYLRPEFLIPIWAGPVIVSYYFLGMVFGSLLAQTLIQRSEWKWFWGCFAAGLFWLLSTAILTFDEYRHIGTYNEYHAGQARPMMMDPQFMFDMNMMGLLIGLPALALAIWFYKRGQRI